MKKSKPVILIVDDNMSFVERIIGLVEEVNNVDFINVASDYDEAYRFLMQEDPDLVLLDINLPGKSGIELLKRIRENGKKCMVIMITNHADMYYRQLCKEMGATYFLDKSNDFARVPEIVSRLYDGKDTVPAE